MNLRDLFLRIRALVAPHRVEHELDEELAFHIERDTQKHIAAGLSPIDARTRAIARFGSVSLAADQCRDERGTGLIDDLARDSLYAFRTFRRAPLAALTIVATIAIGLGLVAAVFTFYSMFFFRVDAVHNPDELFEVVRPTRPGADSWAPLTRADYEALRRESGVFVDVAAMVSGIETRIDGRAASPMLVTGNFFHLLGVHAALGRTLAPGDDEPSAGRPIVFSHRAWMKLFAGDTTIVGRSIRINGVPCVAVGVMPESFRGLNVAPPDFWAPLTLAGEFRPTDAQRGRQAGQRRRPAEARGVARAGDGRARGVGPDASEDGWRSPGVHHTGAAAGHSLGRLARGDRVLLADLLRVRADPDDRLRERRQPAARACGCAPDGRSGSDCRSARHAGASSVNCSPKASSWRSRRRRAASSSPASAWIGASYAVTATMPSEIAEQVNFGVPAADWRVVVFLMVSAVVATIFFGLVPALQASRVELVRAARGEVTRDARPGRARHLLIGVQVGASALLLICAAVFLRSAFAAAQAGPGLRTRDTIVVPIANEPRREAIVREVMAHSSVIAVAASSSSALGEASVVTRQGPRSGEAWPSTTSWSRRDIFQLLEVDLIRGRGFTEAEGAPDAGVAVVSESAARKLWPNGDALGQVLRLQSRAFTVVGVARDVSGGLMQVLSFSGVYLPVGLQDPGTSLLLRVRGDPGQARLALLDRLTRVDPALDHEVQTLRTVAGMGAYILQIAFWVTLLLGGLALALTVSGLFSVLSYLVEQRAREIGVRMALGATTRTIVVLVLSQSVRPVGFGLLAGGGLAAAVAIVLMSTPAAAEIGNTVLVFDPLAYAASLLVIVTSCVAAASIPALRAARVDPIATLRQD